MNTEKRPVILDCDPGIDDALALIISKLARCRIVKAYLITDITVLLLSLSYIPLRRVIYSFFTVTLSSILIDGIQRLELPRRKAGTNGA